MKTYRLYYATNRNHEGKDRWHPDSYGGKFSNDGTENLRFGKLTVEADEKKVRGFLTDKLGFLGTGDGNGLSGYFTDRAERARIEAFPENLDRHKSELVQPNAQLGSQAAFGELRQAMQKHQEVLVYIHGYNVSWRQAVGSALALQTMLAPERVHAKQKGVLVVLFTWPSDGLMLPFVSYKSDRTEAHASGKAFARALLKVRDFLARFQDKDIPPDQRCSQELHLLCHSMGNYVLQESLPRIDQHTPGDALPRIFKHIFLCSADIDDDALESGRPMGQVHEITRNVTIYYNREDLALVVSDHTKGHPERLGSAGAARPKLLHNKVHQVDCTPLAKGFVEHSYYLAGHIAGDICQSIDGLPQNDKTRRRISQGDTANQWAMEAKASARKTRGKSGG